MAGLETKAEGNKAHTSNKFHKTETLEDGRVVHYEWMDGVARVRVTKPDEEEKTIKEIPIKCLNPIADRQAILQILKFVFCISESNRTYERLVASYQRVVLSYGRLAEHLLNVGERR